MGDGAMLGMCAGGGLEGGRCHAGHVCGLQRQVGGRMGDGATLGMCAAYSNRWGAGWGTVPADEWKSNGAVAYRGMCVGWGCSVAYTGRWVGWGCSMCWKVGGGGVIAYAGRWWSGAVAYAGRGLQHLQTRV